METSSGNSPRCGVKRQRPISPQSFVVDDSCDGNGGSIIATLREEIRALKEENARLTEQLQQTQCSSELYKKAFELMNECAYVVRESDVVIMATNRSLDKMLGYVSGAL